MLQSYICHTSYNGKTMNSEPVSIERGEKIERRGEVLFYKETPVCIWRSLVGKRHFAINDDGLGLERGDASWALAYGPRPQVCAENDQGPEQRFTDSEIKVLTDKWGHFLKPNADFILFNDSFFEQSPDVLREVTRSLGATMEKQDVQNSEQ